MNRRVEPAQDSTAPPGDAEANELPALPREQRLNIQAMQDTATRVAGGIYMYLALWLIIAGVTGLTARQPALVLACGGVLAGIALFRSWLTRRFPELVVTRRRFAYRALVISVLANGVCWGVLTAASIWLTELQSIRVAMIVVAVGVCSAGSVAMAIDPILKFWFPIATIAPISMAAAFNINEGNLLLACLIVVYTIYVMHTTGVVHRDYWRALRASADLEQASLTDALTQIANRMSFDRLYLREWRRARRQNDGLGVLMIDLDHFKRINDTHGHPAGDAVLQHVARALQGALLRAGDAVARYGGEEFVVLLPHIDRDGAITVVRRILAEVAGATVATAQTHLHVTCSVGCAWAHPDDQTPPDALLKRADAALYAAKNGGRNQAYCDDGTTSAFKI